MSGSAVVDDPGEVASRPWAWLATGRPATTVAGAESAIVLLLVGTRLGMLVQGLPSFVTGATVSPNRALYVLSWVAAAGAAVGVSVASFRRGSGLPDRVQAVDIALAATLLVVGPLTVSPEHRIGTWEGFQPGYAVAVVMSMAVTRSRALWLSGLAALVAAQVCYVASALDTASLSTTVGNLATLVVLAFVGRGSVQYLRRVAQDADRARAEAAELARRQEEQRAQVAIHNGAAVMQLLSDPGLDDATRDRLIEQATQESIRMRAYLRGAPPASQQIDPSATPSDDPTLRQERDLAALVARKCREFDDLVLETALDLGQGVLVDGAVADAVENALTSLLLNVRIHAGARLVVVHLDAGDARPPTRWVLTVHDDGRGFDPGTVRYGVGLREVVCAALGRHGVDVQVHSAAGEGTTITMSGPAR